MAAKVIPDHSVAEITTVDENCRCDSASASNNNSPNNMKYCCGACRRKFVTICSLHFHLETHYKTGGSYHYDSFIRTAFPKYETFCRVTQTDDDIFVRNADTEISTEDSDHDIAETCPYIKEEQSEVSQGMGYSSDVTEDYFENDSTSNIADDNGTIFEQENSADIVKKCSKRKLKTDKTGSIKKKIQKKSLKPEIGVSVEQVTPMTICASNYNQVNSTTHDHTHSKQAAARTNKGFTCEICNIIFTKNNNLLKHENSKHLDKLTMQCEDCDRKFMRKVDLDNHRLCAHSQNKQQIRKKAMLPPATKDDGSIGDTANASSVTQANKASDDKVKVLGQRKVRKKSELTTPKKKPRSKQEMLLSKLPYTCEWCNKIIPRSKKDTHIRLHTGERPYICSKCGKGLISADKLNRHMLTHADVKKHICEECGAGFHMKYKLKMHMYIHTGKKPFLCSMCGAEFNNSSNLANHNRYVHRQLKPYGCQQCDTRFSRKSALDDHVYRHSTEKHFTCRYCGKSFKYLKGMRRHEKNHVEVDKTVYTCDVCQMVFQRKDTFDRHKLVHTKEAPIECHICKLIVKDHKELAVHAQTHVVKKVFDCLICSQTFTAGTKYYTHMLVMHDVKKDEAKLMHAESKDGKVSQPVADIISKCRPVLDPNLPLPAELVTSSPTKITGSVNTSFNVNAMSSILDEEKATLNAMTRAATENLRLHCQDISEHEKTSPIAHPLAVYKKNNHLESVNHLNNVINFNLPHKNNLVNTSCLEISDHPYGVTLNQSGHSMVDQPRNAVLNAIGLQQATNPLTQLQVSKTAGFPSTGSVLNASVLTSCLESRQLADFSSLANLGNPSVGLHDIQHGAIESLRRLQATSELPVSNSQLISREHSMLSHRQQQRAALPGSVIENESNETNTFRIDSLY